VCFILTPWISIRFLEYQQPYGKALNARSFYYFIYDARLFANGSGPMYGHEAGALQRAAGDKLLLPFESFPTLI